MALVKRIVGWVGKAGTDANLRAAEAKELTCPMVLVYLNAANMRDYRKNNSSPHSRATSRWEEPSRELI